MYRVFMVYKQDGSLNRIRVINTKANTSRWKLFKRDYPLGVREHEAGLSCFSPDTKTMHVIDAMNRYDKKNKLTSIEVFQSRNVKLEIN